MPITQWNYTVGRAIIHRQSPYTAHFGKTSASGRSADLPEIGGELFTRDGTKTTQGRAYPDSFIALTRGTFIMQLNAGVS